MSRVAGIGGVFIKPKDPTALRSEGCNVDDKIEDSEHGKFGWVMDPEGNRVEPWDPPPQTAGNSPG